MPRTINYGSRAINPMELYHNQVTRAQGPYSLRIFHRSWGIMFIQVNIENPSTVLDFPTEGSVRERTDVAPVRCRRDQLDHRQRRQGAGDVPGGRESSRRIRRSLSADM